MNKSDFKVGKKVYVKDSLGTEAYMYALSQNDNDVICTNDPHGYGTKMSRSYSTLTIRKPKTQAEQEKKYKHSRKVVEVFSDVEALVKLLKDNPTYKDTIFQLMRPYVGNARFWDFVLHTSADEPKLQEAINQILIKSKD